MRAFNGTIVALFVLSSTVAFSVTADVSSGTTDSYTRYCTASGGQVEQMPAIFSTQAGNVTGNTKPFCTFNVDNGFIAIGLESFASDVPSIAATYMKTLQELTENSPLWKGKATNPSYNVCRNLGGTAIGFVVSGGFTNPLGESDICVFGDGSMVSAWSLIYMAGHRDGYDSIKNQVKATPMIISMPSLLDNPSQ